LGQNIRARGGVAAPYSGAWVDARVASLRCPIPRPGANSIRLIGEKSGKRLPKNALREYNWIYPA